MIARLLHDPTADGGGTPADPPADPPAEAPPAPKPPEAPPEPKPKAAKGGDAPDPAEGFRQLAETRKGDMRGLAEFLYRDNFAKDQQLREAQARIPGEGSTVLKGDHAKAWDAYRKHGTPEEIAAAFAERDDYKARDAAHERSKSLAAIAGLMKWKPAVFEKLAPEGLEYVVKDEPTNGQPTKVVYARGAGKDGADLPLDQWAAQHVPDFLPALKADQPHTPGRPVGTPPAPGGQRQPIPSERVGQARRRNVFG
jgi:hypothetical protein